MKTRRHRAWIASSVKPGRYVRIGRLLVPVDQPPSAPEIYKIGPDARAIRRAYYREHRLKGRPSNFARIWAILQGR